MGLGLLNPGAERDKAVRKVRKLSINGAFHSLNVAAKFPEL
jgi:hypothetical protein